MVAILWQIFLRRYVQRCRSSTLLQCPIGHNLSEWTSETLIRRYRLILVRITHIGIIVFIILLMTCLWLIISRRVKSCLNCSWEGKLLPFFRGFLWLLILRIRQIKETLDQIGKVQKWKALYYNLRRRKLEIKVGDFVLLEKHWFNSRHQWKVV